MTRLPTLIFACIFLAAVGVAVLLSHRPAPPEPTREAESIRWVSTDSLVSVLHDDARHVTCWTYAHGISCLRDPEPCAKPGVVR